MRFQIHIRHSLFFLLSLHLLFSGCASISVKSTALESPDGTQKIEIGLDADQALHARVVRKGEVIVDSIRFGFVLQDAPDFGKGLNILEVSRRTIDERYPITLGRSREAHNHGNELILLLGETEAPHRKLEVHFRAYNEGVAFRYAFIEGGFSMPVSIVEENSRIEFPADHAVWSSVWEQPNNSNEAEFVKTRISEIESKGWIQTPVTVERDDGVVLSLYQAALKDYAGMYFRKVEDAAPAFQTRLVPKPEGGAPALAVITKPQVTPWRIIQTADRAIGLLDSEFILHFNPHSRIPDTSWIEAGKMTFPWWVAYDAGIEGVEAGNTFETTKAFIDFAADHGIRYHVVEPRWYETRGNIQDGDHAPDNSDPLKPLDEVRIHDVIRYAESRGVSIFLWIHQSLLAANTEEIMKTYKSWGAVGMKVDFFDRLDQETVELYHSLAEEAAEHQLMVFYHGAYTPTGIRRTWPNIVTREAVLANEYNKWSDRITLEHSLTIPFTRMVPGPMDYTPGGFRNVMPEDFKKNFYRPMVMGTRSRELAMFVVYDSPIQMICDAPATYRGAAGTDFMVEVPTSWDETRALQGEIGKYIAMARRKGNTWYLGLMVGNEARSFTLSLDFLEAGQHYRTIQWSDKAGGAPTELVRETGKIKGGPGATLTIEAARGGGATVRFEPLDP